MYVVIWKPGGSSLLEEEEGEEEEQEELEDAAPLRRVLTSAYSRNHEDNCHLLSRRVSTYN